MENDRFVLQTRSDSHHSDLAGNTFLWGEKPAIAAYSVHSTREELWDAVDNCHMNGSQLLKISANVRFDDQMALGRWIDCDMPLTINISAMSTFQGDDHSGKTMCSHLYPTDELEYPICSIWIIKKDKYRGMPWCKIIEHVQPQNHTAVFSFEYWDVRLHDFYYIVINQKEYELTDGQVTCSAFLGPVFIDNVTIG